MRCNVVLKAAHGQILTAASDIDHILIHLVETVESERMSFVYMQYWSKVTLYITVSIRFITITHITIFNVLKRSFYVFMFMTSLMLIKPPFHLKKKILIL